MLAFFAPTGVAVFLSWQQHGLFSPQSVPSEVGHRDLTVAFPV